MWMRSIGLAAMVASGSWLFCSVGMLCVPVAAQQQQPQPQQNNLNSEDKTLHDDTSLLTASEILLKIYDDTRGLRWGQHDNWLQNTDVCSWYGVTCYDETTTTDLRRVGHIQKLELSSNRLLGTLSPEVFQLPYIESIDVRDNADLTMSFLGIAEAQYLKELAFSSSNVQSLQGIDAAATTLEQLHMTSLGLTGSIPAQIFKLTNLRGLFANYNNFNGTVATAIGNLRYATDIFLFDSDLTGTLPTEIGLLSNLETITLADNALSGTLPTELNNCRSLRTLALNRAFGLEKGPGITGPLPSLSQLRDITDLRLQNQRLTGPIPNGFLDNAPKQEIVKVDLTGNAITGQVPSSLQNIARLNLFLADNQITSVPESLCDLNGNGAVAAITAWMGGNLGSLGCDGFLCPPASSSPQGRATAEQPCMSCAGATFWGSTRCASSATTTSMGYSEREVLINLYNKMGGRYWKNDDGWLNPAEPICEWYGVECVDSKVTGLILKNNDLSNSPPEELFSLPELTHLDLESNAIDFKFRGIGRASKLESLLLSSCDLRSLDDIGELSQTSIQRLYLASNYLQGPIPTALFDLVSLVELDITHNRFTSTLPTELGRLTNLELLLFARNEIAGAIPAGVGSLTRLKELIGSDNNFDGTLPTSLGTCTRLERISLHQANSDRGIRGSLPAFQNLGQLTSLQLDSNNLDGSLPEEFLRLTQKGDVEIEVRLNDNHIEGAIPKSWSSRFQKLLLDLSGNKISGVGGSLCSANEWNRGAVERFGCNALLCPPGTFNELGRATGSEATCRACLHPPSVQYYGAKTCDDSENIASQETSELGLLKEFFDSTNGNNWKNNEGWMSSNNPCDDWHGVECNADGEVVAIELESNGLTGTPSSAVFKLSNLRTLSLKDNQLAFSFEGIAQASNLAVLKLSGTNLDSVAGVSQASALTELHLTDNRIGGTFPAELLQLTSLRTCQVLANFIA